MLYKTQPPPSAQSYCFLSPREEQPLQRQDRDAADKNRSDVLTSVEDVQCAGWYVGVDVLLYYLLYNTVLYSTYVP